jgi:hypothetical protein
VQRLESLLSIEDELSDKSGVHAHELELSLGFSEHSEGKQH